VGVSVEGCPGTNVSVLWASVSEATTGTLTVTVTAPDTAAFDVLVARTTAVPPATAVIVADVPFPDTVATDGDSDVHVIDPLAPLGATVALTDPVAPANKARVGGATETEVTPGGCVGPPPPPPQPVKLTSPKRVAAQIWVRRVMVSGEEGVRFRLLTRRFPTIRLMHARTDDAHRGAMACWVLVARAAGPGARSITSGLSALKGCGAPPHSRDFGRAASTRGWP
jgi:hypothetical protein